MKNQEEAAAVAAVMEYINRFLVMDEKRSVSFKSVKKSNNWAKSGRLEQMKKNRDLQMKIY